MVHDLSPILFTIYGDIAVRWYGLSYIMGFVFGYFYVNWITRRQNQNMTSEMIGDLTTAAAIGVILGGRLGYCVFYAPELFLQFKGSFPFWGVLAVNEGGMSSHGGILGLALATMWFAHSRRLNLAYLFDLIGSVGGMGFFFGRLANFINGELVGRIAPPGTTWAVKFPQDILQWPSGEPHRLATLADTVATLPGKSKDQFLQWLSDPSTSAKQSVQDVLQEIVNAIQHGNLATKEAIAGVLDARYPSQLIAALGEGLIVFLILFAFSYKPRKPGTIGAGFLVLYAAMRIFTEQFRLPDAHIGFQALGLTRGQWLSIVMLVIAVVIFFYYWRRNTIPIPGWGKSQDIRISRR